MRLADVARQLGVESSHRSILVFADVLDRPEVDRIVADVVRRLPAGPARAKAFADAMHQLAQTLPRHAKHNTSAKRQAKQRLREQENDDRRIKREDLFARLHRLMRERRSTL